TSTTSTLSLHDALPICLRVNLQYDLPGSVTGNPTEAGGGMLRRTQIRENLAVILENGKSITVAQSADPVGDRQVTIDVKATILRSEEHTSELQSPDHLV